MEESKATTDLFGEFTTEHQVLVVHQVHEHYWFVGYSLESCVATAIDEYDVPADEIEPFNAITRQQLETLVILDEEDGAKRTFAEQLRIEQDAGGEFPRLFACAEF